MLFETPWREELNAENHPLLLQKLRELWQVKTTIASPRKPANPYSFLEIDTLGKLFRATFWES